MPTNNITTIPTSDSVTVALADVDAGAVRGDVDATITWPLDRGASGLAFLLTLPQRVAVLEELVTHRLLAIGDTSISDAPHFGDYPRSDDDTPAMHAIVTITSNEGVDTELDLTLSWEEGRGTTAFHAVRALADAHEQIAGQVAMHLTLTADASLAAHLKTADAPAG